MLILRLSRKKVWQWEPQDSRRCRSPAALHPENNVCSHREGQSHGRPLAPGEGQRVEQSASRAGPRDTATRRLCDYRWPCGSPFRWLPREHGLESGEVGQVHVAIVVHVHGSRAALPARFHRAIQAQADPYAVVEVHAARRPGRSEAACVYMTPENESRSYVCIHVFGLAPFSVPIATKSPFPIRPSPPGGIGQTPRGPGSPESRGAVVRCMTWSWVTWGSGNRRPRTPQPPRTGAPKRSLYAPKLPNRPVISKKGQPQVGSPQ